MKTFRAILHTFIFLLPLSFCAVASQDIRQSSPNSHVWLETSSARLETPRSGRSGSICPCCNQDITLHIFTSNPELYTKDNPKLRELLRTFQSRAARLCPDTDGAFIAGYLNGRMKFTGTVSRRWPGEISGFMDTDQAFAIRDQEAEKRRRRKRELAECEAAPKVDPWMLAKPSSFTATPNACQMLLALADYYKQLFSVGRTVQTNCDLIDDYGCNFVTMEVLSQITLTNFRKGNCDRNGNCTFAATFTCSSPNPASCFSFPLTYPIQEMKGTALFW